ncbi:hypothetical protein [Streptomyces sp. NPDC059874]|uniref:hypothetical protein n=1 Tax=Streptomyces sp. NPDC059874 TaxID=3346983 RepID=UPI00365C6D88
MTEVRMRVSAYALVPEAGRLLLTRLSESSPVFAPGLWYAVRLKGNAAEVAEVNGSTDAVSWIPVSDLREQVLSPAAIDGLRTLGDPAASA